jgi:hypothetical protein
MEGEGGTQAPLLLTHLCPEENAGTWHLGLKAPPQNPVVLGICPMIEETKVPPDQVTVQRVKSWGSERRVQRQEMMLIIF